MNVLIPTDQRTLTQMESETENAWWLTQLGSWSSLLFKSAAYMSSVSKLHSLLDAGGRHLGPNIPKHSIGLLMWTLKCLQTAVTITQIPEAKYDIFKDQNVNVKHLCQQYLVARGNKTHDDNGICHMWAAVVTSGITTLLLVQLPLWNQTSWHHVSQSKDSFG